MNLRIGSRGSQLALWQANHIAAHLRSQRHIVEIEIIKTTGDRLQEVTFAQIGSKGMFTREIEEALDAINSKLIRRHPHVFGEESAETAGDVKRIWGQVKAEEKKDKGKQDGLLAPVPRALPALVEAQQIASKAAGVGFDWQNVDQVIEKLDEELDELRRAADQSQAEDEIGDMLFVIVNIARFLRVDPEQALRRTNSKFRRRFGYLEEKLAESGRALSESNIDEMEMLWQEAKRRDG